MHLLTNRIEGKNDRVPVSARRVVPAFRFVRQAGETKGCIPLKMHGRA